MTLGLRSFVQESSQRSSNISWFDYVQFACASTQSQFEPRFYEGNSFSSIMPSISKKVYHSPCQEWGLSHLPTIRLNELQTIGYQICRDTSGRCCGAGEDLAECLGVLRFPIEDIDGFIPFFWRLRPDSPGAVAFVRQEEENLSSVTWCLPSRGFRGAICCQILSSSRRIYLRLPLLAQLDMPQRMCPYTKEHSLGLPCRLGRLSGGPPLRLRHPGDTLNLHLLLLRRSALKLPLLQSVLRPRRSRPIPRGGFRG